MTYVVHFTPSAKMDLLKARDFYSEVDLELGKYCSDSLLLDAERLTFFAGIHQSQYGYYRLLARSFPFSIYYKIIKDEVVIAAVLDNRNDPQGIIERLTHEDLEVS